VIRLEGRNEQAQPFSVIRAAIPEAAQLPLTLTDPTEVAAALRRAWAAGALVTVIAADEVMQIDRASLAVVRALVTVVRGGSPVGVVHTSGDNEADLAPRGTPLRDTIQLRPLSRDGVRAWLRSICRWEPPLDFVDWMYEQSAGLPGNVREKLLQLVEHRRLIREDEQWVLAPDYRDVGLPEAVMPAALRLGVQPAPTRLVGSEGALRQVLRLVRTTRLVTLCGPAGCGKSRLALEVALEVTENLRDGVALVTLQPGMTPLEVATAIALRLDLPGLPGADAWVALARQLRTHKLLLVLDGFEEVEGGAQAIALLLAHAPELRILVTSHQALGLQEEWAFPVDRLRVPRSSEPVQAPGFTAVQLFVERLLLANPQFRLGDAEAANVARICQLLDGSPLAIEITAGQTAALSSRELLESLEEALELVSSYLPSAAPEQLRFRATMELAWRLLPEGARAVLRRLSVFPADFDESAGEQIASAQSADLELLVARGLLARIAGHRFLIHPLVRSYTAEKLDDYPRDRSHLLTTYRTHYLSMASRLGAQLQSSITAQAAVATFITELPNMRRAWSLSLGDAPDGNFAGAARALFDFFVLQQLHADAHAFFGNALRWKRADTPALLRSSDAVVELLTARHGATLLFTGSLLEARVQLMAAGAAARRLGSREEEVLCIRYAGLVEAELDNQSMAEEFGRAAVMLARKSGDGHELVLALRDAALIAARGGSARRAIELLREALAVETPSVGKRSAWNALLQIVREVSAAGDNQLARAVLQQVMTDRATEPDVHARAESLLATLHDAEDTTATNPGASAGAPEQSATPNVMP
jgi:predicted ATPase